MPISPLSNGSSAMMCSRLVSTSRPIATFVHFADGLADHCEGVCPTHKDDADVATRRSRFEEAQRVEAISGRLAPELQARVVRSTRARCREG